MLPYLPCRTQASYPANPLPYRLRLMGIKRGTLLLNGSVTYWCMLPPIFGVSLFFCSMNPLPGEFFFSRHNFFYLLTGITHPPVCSVRSLALSKLPCGSFCAPSFCSMILCRPASAYGDKSGAPPVRQTRHIPLYAPRLPPGTPNFSSVSLCRGVFSQKNLFRRLPGNKPSLL